ncbi:MAG TPA: hypothetical protein VFG83_18575 [Kofleriaceae bacterium]|nr:hypothetical protein [Kofleriaceae bacterium]
MDVRRHGSRVVVVMAGVIDENADLSPLTSLDTDALELDLKDVQRVNSFGVRAWIAAMSQIPPSVTLELIHCPPAIVDQCNMVAGFLGHGTLKSFYAMMTCSDCDIEKAELFDSKACRLAGGKLSPVACPSCGLPMVLDDIEDYYLTFLRD